MGYFRLFFALVFAAGLAAYPAQALTAAQLAISNWALTVAPAIFPFVAVMPFLSCPEACLIYERLFGKIVKRLFRLPGSAASAIVTGLLAGSPAGAMAVAEISAREKLTAGQTARLAGLACGVSPVYALTVMGVALSGSRAVGWRLVISQLAAQLFTGIVFRKCFSQGGMPECRPAQHAQKPVAGAVLAVLKVAGYMTMFSVGTELAANVFGRRIRWLTPLIDLPTGAVFCADNDLPLWIAAAALGFSGLCIIFQNTDVLGIPVSRLIAQKTVCAAFCAGAYCALERVNIPVPAFLNVKNSDDFAVSTIILTVIMLPTMLFFVRKTYFLTKGTLAKK